MPPVDRAPVLLALLVAAPAVTGAAGPADLQGPPSGSSTSLASGDRVPDLPSASPTGLAPGTPHPEDRLPEPPGASSTSLAPGAPPPEDRPPVVSNASPESPASGNRLPGLPTAFSTSLLHRAPLPAPAVVDHPEALPLVLTVDGPAGIVPPTEVQLNGSDARGTPLRFSPNPVPLEPGRHRYPVNATYRAPALGPAELAAHARGPGRARANWTTTLPVALDPVAVTIVDVGETAPDWQVPVTVRANTTRLPADAAALVPRIRSADADPATTWNATATPANLTDDPATYDLSFAARYGAGRYQVQVAADGHRSQGRSAPVLVDVEEPPDPSGEAPVEARVPDRPATLHLASDSVNDDGKAKYPGQTLITRLVARDPNGLEADAVDVTVLRERPDGTPVPVRNASLPLPEDAWARREVALEDRFAWAPLKDAPYLLRARLPGADAPAERTFRIRDEQPTLAEGSLPDAVATSPPPTLEGEAVVADDNLGGGPSGPPVAELGTLSARLYRYTQELATPAQVTFPGGRTTLDLSATTSHPSNHTYHTLGDAGRFRIPLQVHLPRDAEPGTYHVTVEHRRPGDVEDLGTIYFEVHPEPAVAGLETGPARPGEPLAVNGSLDHPERAAGLNLTLLGPPRNGSRPVLAEANASGFPARVPVPDGLPPGATLRVRATPTLEDGRRGAPADAPVAVAPRAPALRVAAAVDGAPAPEGPLRLLPGTAAGLNLTLDAAGHHHRPPDVSARLLDWNGDLREAARCPDPGGPPRAVPCRLPVPLDLPVGRYTVQARAQGPGGTTTWNRSLEVGPWLEVGLAGPLPLEPAGDGTLAGTAPLRNDGNVPVHRLRVTLDALDGPGDATWRPSDPAVDLAGAAVEASPAPGGAVLAGADGPALAPGEDADLRLEVPLPAGVPPGSYTGSVTVATTLEAPT